MNFDLNDIKLLIEETMTRKAIPDTWLTQRWEKEKARSNGNGHYYYQLFYRIAKELKPKITVELGGWRGLAAGHFAGGNPSGFVLSLDHHSDPGDDDNQQAMREVENHFSNMRYFQGWSTPEYVEEYHKGKNAFDDVFNFLDGRKISCLFIDSWHEGRYMLRDWKYYKPLLEENALIIVDDIFDSELFVGMLDAWESLPGEKFVNNEVHSGIPMGFIKL